MSWLKKRFREPSTQAALSSLFTLIAVLTGRPEVSAIGSAIAQAGQSYVETGSVAATIGAVVTAGAAIILKEKGAQDAKNQ